MPPDPRDAEFIEAAIAALIGLIVAVHRGEPPLIFAEANRLFAVIVEHDALRKGERPDDEHVRRAIAALCR